MRELVAVFERHEADISTRNPAKGLTSDEVLTLLRPDLVELGFQVEAGKRSEQKIRRPVFFGENAQPSLQYEIDAWHPEWRAGLEVEAGRAWMGNAVYRDLIQALVMVDLQHLVLTVPNSYRYKTGGRNVTRTTTTTPSPWLMRSLGTRVSKCHSPCASSDISRSNYHIWYGSRFVLGKY
ncbi:MAG: hypothetical protein RIE22_08755 [Alphaproteobacteria bacterium]